MSFPPKVSVLLAVLLLAISATADDHAPAGKEIDPKQIEVTLVPDKTVIMLGEPVYVSLNVKNNSNHHLVLDQTTADIPSNIKLTAVDQEGRKLPEFDWSATKAIWPSDQITSEHRYELPPSGSVAIRVFVPWWVRFEQPGTYTIAATGYVSVHEKIPDENVAANSALKPIKDQSVPVTASAKIEVVAVDAKKMDALADESIQKASPKNFMDNFEIGVGEAREKLEVIPDERVIPYFQKAYKADDIFAWSDALYAVSRFNNDAVLGILKTAMETPVRPPSQDPLQWGQSYRVELHEIAAFCLLHSPHPGAIPYLLTYRNSPEAAVCNIVVKALLTKVPRKEAIPVLEEMAAGRNENASGYAKEALKQFSAKPGSP